MDVSNEIIYSIGGAMAAACSFMFRWIIKRLERQERRSEECERDRTVLLQFANHAISRDAGLEQELARDLSNTQLIRLTKRHA